MQIEITVDQKLDIVVKLNLENTPKSADLKIDPEILDSSAKNSHIGHKLIGIELAAEDGAGRVQGENNV